MVSQAFEDSGNGFLSLSGASIVLDQMGDEKNAFEVLSGDADTHTFVNVEILKKVFENT